MVENGEKLKRNAEPGACNEVVEVREKHGFISKLNLLLKRPNRTVQEKAQNIDSNVKISENSEQPCRRSSKGLPHSCDDKPRSQVQFQESSLDFTLALHPSSSLQNGKHPAASSSYKKGEVAIAPADLSQYHILAGEDTTFLIEILKFLIAPPTPTQNQNQNNYNKTMMNGPRRMLLAGCTSIQHTKILVKHDIRACHAISKLWNEAIWEIFSPAIPGVISTPELAQLKLRIYRLNLSSLDAVFIQNLKELWGNDTIDWGRKKINSLQALLSYMNQSHEDFANMVSKEYKKFLLVKAVEVIAAARGEDNIGINTKTFCWKEKCQPSKVVDMYWHSHMLSPRKYYHDCMAFDKMDRILSPQSSPVWRGNKTLHTLQAHTFRIMNMN